MKNRMKKTVAVISALALCAAFASCKKGNKTAALMHAAFTNEIDIANQLIKAGADVNATDKAGWTALFYAVYGESSDIAKKLIEKGADVNAKDDYTITALMYAAGKTR